MAHKYARNYQKSGHRAGGNGQCKPCEPSPSRVDFEDTILRLRAKHADWSAVRVRQRALVEVFRLPV